MTEKKQEPIDDVVLHIDLINFIEVLGEKYEFDQEEEWKIFIGEDC